MAKPKGLEMNEVEEMERQILELQAKVAQARLGQRAEVLAWMKEQQRIYRFSRRELGNYFKPMRTRKNEGEDNG
jgi:hypothetical protein